MAILVIYVDLRQQPSILLKALINYQPKMTALDAVQQALGLSRAEAIERELDNDNKDLIVAWNNAVTDETSEIGGVGSLKWQIDDHSVLTVSYWIPSTTQEQIDEFIEWSNEHYEDFRSQCSS